MLQTKAVLKIKTHILCPGTFLKSCRLRNNVEKYCRAGRVTDDNVTRLMRTACWIPKATNTHLQYVVFPLQQLLHEGASMLRYIDIASNVNYFK